MDQLESDVPEPGNVPCGLCRLCCQNWDVVRMLEGDDVASYEVEPHPAGFPHLMLRHKPNGDCVYLDRATGCTIHDRCPRMCREMDCRNIHSNVSRKESRSDPRLHAIWKKGRDLKEEINA